MKTSTKVVFCMMILLWSISSTSICPDKSVFIEKSQSIPESFSGPSSLENLKKFYEITYFSDKAVISYRRIANQEATVQIGLQTDSFDLEQNSRIVGTSHSGNCVAVHSDTKIYAYSTFNGPFLQQQVFQDLTYNSQVQYILSDDCSIIARLEYLEQGTDIRWYKDYAQSDQIFFNENIAFDQNLRYVIDNERNLYSLSPQGVYTKKIYPDLKVEPVSVTWSNALRAVIAITRHTQAYGILVIDPNADEILYKRTFTSSFNYTGNTLHFQIKEEQVSILIRDDQGFVSFIQLQKQDDNVVETLNTLADSTQSPSFKPPALVSVSNNIIFVYAQNSINYFEALNGLITHLSGYEVDILAAAFNKRSTNPETSANVVFSLISPQQLGLCNVASQDKNAADIVSNAEITTPALIDVQTGSVYQCPKNCLSCSSIEKCTSCETGYVLVKETGVCRPCQGCLTCSDTDTTICYSCFSPQYLDKQTNKCVFPVCKIDNCHQCNSAGFCLACKMGYGLINQQCLPCKDKGCSSCSFGVDSCTPGMCRPGYIYWANPNPGAQDPNGICQPCTAGIQTCDITDLSVAFKCAVGNYMYEDNAKFKRCAPCFQNCRECTSATKCTKCATGFIPSEDGTKCVVRCSDNCLTCDANNANKCLTCYEGAELNTTTNKCQSIKDCSLTKTCTFCDEGFVLSGGQCLECSYTDNNCDACLANSPSLCASCKLGYYLIEDSCQLCQKGCADCVGAQSCVRCNDGFFMVSYANKDLGSCSACDSTCKTCSTAAHICTSCGTDFELIGSKCISKKNVLIDMVLTANPNEFASFMNDFKAWFIEIANQYKEADAKSITESQVAITKTLKFGSTQAQVSVSADTNSNGYAIANGINAAIAQGQKINGYSIVSGSASVQTDQPDPVIPEEKSNLGLILGLSIPLGLLALVSIVIIGVKLVQRSKSKKGGYKDDDRKSVDHLGQSSGRIETRF